MYRHCLYCKSDLAANEVCESFPVGRRLAFDEARGRLWVVCTHCTRWNLSPLEERWEAIEDCDRAFRAARRRVSTENIGLAALPEGLELVRVGRPERTEFAAWRYGRQLLRRRRRHRLGVATNVIGLASASIPLFSLWEAYLDQRVVARCTDESGTRFEIKRKAAPKVRLRPSDDEHGWLLAVPNGPHVVELHGERAVRMAGLLLPHVNRSGADELQVETAVREIEAAGGAESFFRRAAQRVDRHEAYALFRPYDHRVQKSPPELRLAIEMAAHEETERRALEGELAALEADWREAEEIAAIADDLLLPPSLRTMLDRLKGRESRTSSSRVNA
jgi:hypothetical protein